MRTYMRGFMKPQIVKRKQIEYTGRLELVKEDAYAGDSAITSYTLQGTKVVTRSS